MSFYGLMWGFKTSDTGKKQPLNSTWDAHLDMAAHTVYFTAWVCITIRNNKIKRVHCRISWCPNLNPVHCIAEKRNLVHLVLGDYSKTSLSPVMVEFEDIFSSNIGTARHRGKINRNTATSDKLLKEVLHSSISIHKCSEMLFFKETELIYVVNRFTNRFPHSSKYRL